MGASEPVTTDALVSIVGVRADVVSPSNKEQLVQRLPHPFIAQMNDGDVLWPVRDVAKGKIHVCAVRMSKVEGEPAVGLMHRDKGEEHQGPVTIVDGCIVLQSGKRRYDLLTCRLAK